MEVNKGDVVLPGDRIKNITLCNEKEIVILGPGLRRDDDTVFVCKAGILKKREPTVYYVDSYQKRYKIYIRSVFINACAPILLCKFILKVKIIKCFVKCITLILLI